MNFFILESSLAELIWLTQLENGYIAACSYMSLAIDDGKFDLTSCSHMEVATLVNSFFYSHISGL